MIKLISIIISCLLILTFAVSCSDKETQKEEITDIANNSDAPVETTVNETDVPSETIASETENKEDNPEEKPEIYNSNWVYSSECSLNPSEKDIITSAIKKISGEIISPLAYLGYQEGESGRNHIYLCGYAISPAEKSMTFSVVYVNQNKSTGSCNIIKKASLGSLVCDDDKKPDSYKIDSGIRMKFSEAFEGYVGIGVQLISLAQSYTDEFGTQHFYLVVKTSPVGPPEMFPSYNPYDPPYSILHLEVSETGRPVFDWIR